MMPGAFNSGISQIQETAPQWRDIEGGYAYDWIGLL